MSRVFLQVFFHESSSPKPLEITIRQFQFFSKIRRDIRKARCTKNLPLLSKTLAANLPPVSTTPVPRRLTVNFPAVLLVLLIPVAIMNLKKKNYLYVNFTTQRYPNKIFKLSWLKVLIFSICHQCQRHLWCTLSYEYLSEFKKLKWPNWDTHYSGAWEKRINKKTWSRKSCGTVALSTTAMKKSLWIP